MPGCVKSAKNIQKLEMTIGKVNHNEHPSKMFQLHLNGKKYKKAINKKHALHSMLRKGNIKPQITTGIVNSLIEKVQRNRTVIPKPIKAVYFKSKNNGL